ncbi:MAG: hypothetical protein HYT36_02950 [Candidatus Staskawiczbacteria bacterium]|nr:hypothetical protein [Candidatus Staskawiczbacteria bacterium]
MFDKIKIKIENYKLARIKKIPWIFGLRAFWIILLLVFASSMFGLFLFYKYAVLVEREEITIAGGSLKFKNNIYQKVLEQWQLKEDKFMELKTEEYQNPFFLKKSDEKESKNQKESENKSDEKRGKPVIK